MNVPVTTPRNPKHVCTLDRPRISLRTPPVSLVGNAGHLDGRHLKRERERENKIVVGVIS